MTTQLDRFSTGKNDLVFVPAESDRDRETAFLEPFGVKPVGATFIDASGYPLGLSPAWTAGLDRYAADELRRVAQAIAHPAEIRTLWKRGDDNRPMLTRRYFATIDDVAIAADVNRAGWCFATSEDPGFDLALLRVGDVAWADPSQQD